MAQLLDFTAILQLFAVVKFYYDERVAKTIEVEFDRLIEGFEKFATWTVMPVQSNFAAIPSEIRAVLPEDASPEEAQVPFENYMTESIGGILRKHPGVKFQTLLFYRGNRHRLPGMVFGLVVAVPMLGYLCIVAAAVWQKMVS